MRILLILLILSTSTFAKNDISKIESFLLKDGTKVDFKKDVEVFEVSTDRENKIEWVELKEGTLIDSTDIQQINIDDSVLNANINQILRNDGLVRMDAGDGSGG